MGNTSLMGLVVMSLLSVGAVVAIAKPEWLTGPSQGPVLVFLVEDERSVSQFKAAVAPERIVSESPQAIAVIEGRIVGADAEAASRAINEAGWVERRIEMFHIPRRAWRGGQASQEEGDVDPKRLARLAELTKKRTLNVGEQLFVLQAMNEGIAF